MAGEIRVPYQYDASYTVYAVIRRSSDTQVWYIAGQTFEAWGTGGRDADDYDITLSHAGGSLYEGDFDTNIASGSRVAVAAYVTETGTPADTDYLVHYIDNQYWDGTNLYWYPIQSYGPGTNACIATIRTTAGTPLENVQVWLNTSNDRTGSVVQPLYTDGSGNATFYLTDDVTYYVFCNLSGYTFAASSWTPTSGNRDETLDIATAVSGSSSSDYDTSFLARMIAEVRLNIDEPSTSAKYTDSQIIDKLEQAYHQIVGEINRNAQNPVIASYDLTIAENTTEYILPPTVGAVYAVYIAGDEGTKVFYDSRSPYSQGGQGVWAEGNILHLQTTNIMAVGSSLTVEYIPDGTPLLHEGTCTLDADADTVTLDTTPNRGTLDTRLNAYAGCMFRLFKVTGTGATNNYVQERKINSYDRESGTITLSNALDPIPTAGTGGALYYEICPQIHKGIDTVVAMGAAYLISLIEGQSKRASMLQQAYRSQLRTVRLQAFYSNLQEATRVRADGFRVRRGRRFR